MLKIDGTLVERSRSTKFLGVILDENINWKPHIETIERKISKSIGILNNAKAI